MRYRGRRKGYGRRRGRRFTRRFGSKYSKGRKGFKRYRRTKHLNFPATSSRGGYQF